MKYGDLFSCMEYIIILLGFQRREKWVETPKDVVCYASMGEDGEGDGALGVRANKGFRPLWQAGPACNWLYFNTGCIGFHLQEHTDMFLVRIHLYWQKELLYSVHANALLMQVYNVRSSE